MAYGALALSPAELGRLTAGELLDMFEGWLWRYERDMHKLAWQTAHLLNIHLQKTDRVNPSDLLGYEITLLRTVQEAERTLEDKKREIAELKEEFAGVFDNIDPSRLHVE